MNINKMTRKQFEALPHRKWNKNVVCTSIIILPSQHLHESGYRYMDFVAVNGTKPICLLSGCSDVVHIDGISGRAKGNTVSRWSIDCLPKSGLLRIWPASKRILCTEAVSSFEIFAVGLKGSLEEPNLAAARVVLALIESWEREDGDYDAEVWNSFE